MPSCARTSVFGLVYNMYKSTLKAFIRLLYSLHFLEFDQNKTFCFLRDHALTSHPFSALVMLGVLHCVKIAVLTVQNMVAYTHTSRLHLYTFYSLYLYCYFMT